MDSASFSTDGTHIVTASGEFGKPGEAKVWDAKNGTELLTLRGHTGRVDTATFSLDGTRIVTGSDDNTAKVWDAKTGAELLTLKGSVSATAFSADGNRILARTRNGLLVWNAPAQLPVAPIPRAK